MYAPTILTIYSASETAFFTRQSRSTKVSSERRSPVSLMLRPPWMGSANAATSLVVCGYVGEEGLGAVARCELAGEPVENENAREVYLGYSLRGDVSL
jgi:hypothetical protein